MCQAIGCGQLAKWRTTLGGAVVMPMCVTHMELARDMGVKDEDIHAMPERKAS